MPSPSRRDTLGLLLWGSLATVAAPAVYVAGRYLSPPEKGISTVAVGPISEVPAGSSRIVKVGSADAIVLRDQAGEVQAFNLRCTHAGCNVRWQADEGDGGVFICPCHGGRFGRDGAVLKGPPRKPLVKLEIRTEEDMIIVTDAPASTTA